MPTAGQLEQLEALERTLELTGEMLNIRPVNVPAIVGGLDYDLDGHTVLPTPRSTNRHVMVRPPLLQLPRTCLLMLARTKFGPLGSGSNSGAPHAGWSL